MDYSPFGCGIRPNITLQNIFCLYNTKSIGEVVINTLLIPILLQVLSTLGSNSMVVWDWIEVKSEHVWREVSKMWIWADKWCTDSWYGARLQTYNQWFTFAIKHCYTASTTVQSNTAIPVSDPMHSQRHIMSAMHVIWRNRPLSDERRTPSLQTLFLANHNTTPNITFICDYSLKNNIAFSELLYRYQLFSLSIVRIGSLTICQSIPSIHNRISHLSHLCLVLFKLKTFDLSLNTISFSQLL